MEETALKMDVLEKGGTVQRFVIYCNKRDAQKVKAATHNTITWLKTKGGWSCPPDPKIFRSMLDAFGDRLVTTKTLDNYLHALYDHQLEVIDSTTKTQSLHPDLRPFQNGSVQFLNTAGRCILGHETGVGKTPPACVALDYANARRVIVICLNTLKWQWAEHLSKWSQLRNIYILESTLIRDEFDYSLIKGTIAEQTKHLLPILANEDEFVLVMNYTTFRLHHVNLIKYGYDVVIADEAHRLINRKAQQTAAFYKLMNKTKMVWLLTGTPVRNNFADVISLLKICDPERFSSYWNTVFTHFETVPGIFGGWEVVGLQDEESYNQMLATYMYRETKASVLPQMPPKIVEEIRIPMQINQRNTYKKMEKELIMAIEEETGKGTQWHELFKIPSVLALQTRLRQVCLTPALLGGKNLSGKLEALRELLANYYEDGHKVLVFTMFRQFIPYMEEIANSLSIPYGKIVGGMNIQQYKKVESDLNNSKIHLIFGTTQAMGEGLNLQAASVAVFMDSSWVPAENKQAEDRIHRGDITESPLIVRLYHKDTIEEDIMAILERKEGVEQTTIGEVEIIRHLIQRRKR